MKILLVNRHMNIGGVETYLYRLCAGLRAKGHDVGLLTEGGLYEDKVVATGARLHKVKFLAKDWEQALPELRSCNYQLVHGHNYHSARVARRLGARLGVPYLMSVHGPRPRLKQLLFRDWSREVIVMSEGDRDNICWWGGVRRGRVALSFYGIDTDRFHPAVDTTRARATAGIEPGERAIVFVSRFSNRKADVGHALLDALPTLAERSEKIKLLLVGEGPETAALAEHLARVNASAGRELARLIGPRKDVEAFMCLATVAVCTANTAQEALACGRPTLAAGRTGYFGLVTPANFEAARALCFADHGCSPEPVTPEVFLRDLPDLLNRAEEHRRQALVAADFVAERLSIARMTVEMEEIYRRQLARFSEGR